MTLSLLWIAFNLVSLHLQKQRVIWTSDCVLVVNCFQFSIFAFAKTTVTDPDIELGVLCIAFNLVSLHLQKQPCKKLADKLGVVNCFQFSIFAFAKTTHTFYFVPFIQLWIAFNLVSLHLQKQHWKHYPYFENCCELLSI